MGTNGYYYIFLYKDILLLCENGYHFRLNTERLCGVNKYYIVFHPEFLDYIFNEKGPFWNTINLPKSLALSYTVHQKPLKLSKSFHTFTLIFRGLHLREATIDLQWVCYIPSKNICLLTSLIQFFLTIFLTKQILCGLMMPFSMKQLDIIICQ